MTCRLNPFLQTFLEYQAVLQKNEESTYLFHPVLQRYLHRKKILLAIMDPRMELSFYNIKCSIFKYLFSVFQAYMSVEIKKCSPPPLE